MNHQFDSDWDAQDNLKPEREEPDYRYEQEGYQ